MSESSRKAINKTTEKPDKTHNPQPVQPQETPKCHVHDEIDPWDKIDDIREQVCISIEEVEKFGLENRLTEMDNKHYCLFHLPTKEKDNKKFDKIFYARLDAIDKQCAAIEAKFPNNKQKQVSHISLENLTYDFRYIWFPTYVSLNGRKFLAYADFSSTTFNGYSNFESAIFNAYVNFNSTTFNSSVDFSSATFHKTANFEFATFTHVNFSSATFCDSAKFNLGKFNALAHFGMTTFESSAQFSNATFSGSVHFSSTTFANSVFFNLAIIKEKTQIYFNEAKFCSKINFHETEIEGYVEFSGDIFLDAEQVQIVKKELEEDYAELKEEAERQGNDFVVPIINIEDNQKAILNLQEVRLRNPERVSFNSMKLHPNWFVNVDEARKIAFNDVEWQNIEIDIDRNGLDEELKSVKAREILRPEKSLIKACNQLADNAEANRRFEEAKQLRKQAIALENKDCYVHFAVDSHNKVDIRDKICNGYPTVNDDGGNYYCLWHNPDKNKAEVFLKEFLKEQSAGRKDFRAVVFPITVEYGGKINDELNFTGATFQRRIIFKDAKIHGLNFNEAYFEEDAGLVFENSTCKGKINLDKAVFDGKLLFKGNKGEFFASPKAALSMKESHFDNPNNANFRSIRLRPHYFIDSEPSKFNFHECDWINEAGQKIDIDKEIINCGNHKTLAQVCNQLAINYEESRDFEQSSYFRSTAMEAKRLDNTSVGKILNLYWFYKQTSSYGESWVRAAVVLLGILLLFSVFYTAPFANFDFGEKKREIAGDAVDKQMDEVLAKAERFRSLTWDESIVHSLSVAALQRPEPKAEGTLTKFFIISETIFAPLQAALLALAIRRKFMR